MRLAQSELGGIPHVIVQRGTGSWRAIPDPIRLFDLVRQGRDHVLAQCDIALKTGREIDVGPVENASWGTPSTVRDFYAFEDHVRAGRRSRGLQMDPLWYEQPVFYFSNPYAARTGGPIPITPRSAEFDFELEVAAVLWSGGENIAPDRGEELIAGFCVMNDWSGRDVQREEMRLSLGPVKGKDSATSLGPVLVTVDDLADTRRGNAFDLAMTARVNGHIYSQSNLRELSWSFPEMIAYASRGTEVRAGDVIGSGTANGGCLLELRDRAGGDDLPWLRAGDVVELEVERIGVLRNTVTDAPAYHTLQATKGT